MSTEPSMINTEAFLRRSVSETMTPDFLKQTMLVYISIVNAKQHLKLLLDQNPAPIGLIKTYEQLIASLEKVYGSP